MTWQERSLDFTRIWTPEKCYERWYKRIVDSAIDSVQASVKEMIEEGKSENTYLCMDSPEEGAYLYTMRRLTG